MDLISKARTLPGPVRRGNNILVLDAKPLLKEALQAEVGLPVDRDIPLIGFIGRLEEQKGSYILVETIPELAGENLQIIILVLTEGKQKDVLKVAGALFSHICEV